MARSETARPPAPGYRVQVAYTVGVEAIVDLEEGRVDRVVVIDEDPVLDRAQGARREGDLAAIPAPIARWATEVAERSGWPVWEKGF